MSLLKKHKQSLTDRQERTAGRIANRILNAQRKAADYLNGKTGRFSVGTWRILLFIFCGAFGSYCLYMLITASSTN